MLFLPKASDYRTTEVGIVLVTNRTINFSDEASFIRESGKLFLRELQEDAANPNAPERITRDWETIARWLGHTSGNLSAASVDKLERAWTGYLAIGLAPSAELQNAFSHCAKKLGSVPVSDRAPTEIMDVFDRLLATDESIKSKRAADLKAERERLAPMFARLKGHARPSWWRRQPFIVRNWLFGSGVWMAFMLLYALFFDPLDTGGWKYMNDKEALQLIFILLIPVHAGAIFYIYQKWVR